MNGAHRVEITRHFKARAEAVYNAWVQPELLTQWMGPGSVTCAKFVSDLRVGGQYEIHMQTDTEIVIAYGEYREIKPNKKLAFTWQWRHIDMENSLVELTFTPTEQGSTLLLQHSMLQTAEIAEQHDHGWSASLLKLEQFINQND